MKTLIKMLRCSFWIFYIFIVLGFVFHTSPKNEYILFGKYSLPYFSFLIYIVLLGYLFLKYYSIIHRWFRYDSKFVLGHRKILFQASTKKILLILFLIFCFFLIEFQLMQKKRRLILDTFHPFLQAKTIANDKRLHINSFGFRGEEIQMVKPPNTVRIFFMGGSSVYGDRTDYEYTFPRLIEKYLQQRYPSKRIEVLNAGYHWYTSQHSIISYLFKISDFQPDIIIICHGINDLCRSFTPVAFSYGKYQNDYSHYYGPISRLIFQSTKGLFQCPFFISSFNQFIRNVFFSDFRKNIDIVMPHFREVDVNIFPSLSAYRRNMQRLIDFTSEDNTKLILATQPSLYRLDLPSHAREALIFPGLFCNIDNTMPNLASMVEGMRQFNVTTVELAKKNDIFLIDLDALAPKTLDYFLDDCHYTKNGHRLIADVIFKFFIDNNILKNFD